MAPFAFCTNPKCRRVFDFCEGCNEIDKKRQHLAESCDCDDERKSHSTVLPPSACPDCSSKVVAWCPRCLGSIANKPEGDEPKCVHCGAELVGRVKAKPLKMDNSTCRAAAASE